ncbi:Ig-like domain-containing protein [Gemmatimonas sp.]|uniref:Ig-like domain-containing protein n=1 Tax=Gemmatimonas sp. TaxID=1962908 RepID=UPI0039830F98
MRISQFRRIAVVLVACTSVLLAGCDSSSSTAAMTLSSIAVSPTTASLPIGGTQPLTVSAPYSDNSTAALTSGVTFTSSASTVATASTAGLVTALAANTTTITTTASGKSATALITVAPAAPTLSSIAVTPATVTLLVAATQPLTITGTYSDATTGALTTGVTFASSAANVATVSSTGLVTAVSAGTTTITATHTASTRTTTRLVTVTAPVATGSVVFSDAYDAGISFADFGGATNAVTIDATTLYNGKKTIKAVVTGGGGYSGGAFVATTTRNLSTFNALTFWARSSAANATLKVGIGNNAATTALNAELIGLPLTTTFTKYIIPMPNPSKATAMNGLFHFADGPNNYTVWFADVQYESLPASHVAAPTAATVAWPALNVAVGAPQQLNPGPNTVSFTTPDLPNGGKLTDVAWRWYTLASSNPAVATVSVAGLVTGVSAGTATITATMSGLAVASSSTVTVSAPLAAPTTIAAAPTKAAVDVISLFTTVYTNRGVDTFRTSWSAANSELTDPFTVAGRAIKKSSLFNFVGIEFGPGVPANNIDATTMTSLHVDVWSPNPSTTLEIQLVNDATGTPAIGQYQAGQIATGSWVSLNSPLASFVGLTAKNKLQQMLFVAGGPTVLYVDNIYFFR